MSFDGKSTDELKATYKAAHQFLSLLVPGTEVHTLAYQKILEVRDEIRIRKFVEWHNEIAAALGEEPTPEPELRKAIKKVRKL